MFWLKSLKAMYWPKQYSLFKAMKKIKIKLVANGKKRTLCPSSLIVFRFGLHHFVFQFRTLWSHRTAGNRTSGFSNIIKIKVTYLLNVGFTDINYITENK